MIAKALDRRLAEPAALPGPRDDPQRVIGGSRPDGEERWFSRMQFRGAFVAVALWAGTASSAVVENVPPGPTEPASDSTKKPVVAPQSNLILWRNLGTTFDDGTKFLVPHPVASGETTRIDGFDSDLFRTDRTGPEQR